MTLQRITPVAVLLAAVLAMGAEIARAQETVNIAVKATVGVVNPSAEKLIVTGARSGSAWTFNSQCIANVGFVGERNAPRLVIIGTPDTSFGFDGQAIAEFDGAPANATGVAIQADGKIVVAGFVNRHDFAVARFNSDGSLDTSFGDDGEVTTDLGSVDVANSIAIQLDGKIVVAGYSSQSGTWRDFALVRYNPDGSLDTTFDADGVVTTDFDISTDEAHSVAIDDEGAIVAAGRTFKGSGYQFALARYKADGSIDATFNGNVTSDLGATRAESHSVAIQTNGKVVAAGTVYQSGIGTWFALARYNMDGTLDATFDSDGVVTTAFADAGAVAEDATIRCQSQSPLV